MNKPRADMTRPIDNLGRIVIPAEIRRMAHIEPGGLLVITATPDGILLRPAKDRCALCGGTDELITVDGITICLECGRKIKNIFSKEGGTRNG